MKNLGLKTATALAASVWFNTSAVANPPNTLEDPLEKNKTELVVDNELTAPQVKEGAYRDVRDASRNGRIALHVEHGTKSAMTPEQLARTFANAFVNRDNDGNPINMTDKPIFATAVYEETDDEKSYISVYIDGVQQTFKDPEGNPRTIFSPNDFWNGVDAVAERYVAKHGLDKVVPETQPISVATLEKN